MKSFADVSTALQIGVRRSPYTQSGYLKEWHGDSREKTALVEAGVLDLMRRAGATASDSNKPLDVAPPEDRRVAQASAIPLMEAIDLGLLNVVLDWAKDAARRGLVAPHAVLVKLISWLPKHRDELVPILGIRGIWLVEQMKIDLGLPETDLNPAEHRSRLQSEWDQLDWKQRVDGIAKLGSDLLPVDEPLLVAALADRRKEVRELSAKCLAKLEDSAFACTIRAAAKGRIRVDRKLLSKQMVVQPPEPDDLPKPLPRSTPRESFGVKALALFDLLSLVQPSFWEQETGLSPEDLLSLVSKTDYADALVYGWTEAAAVHFRDQRWIDALFRHFESSSNQAPLRMLAPMASLSCFEEVYRLKLNSNASLPVRSDRFSPQFSKLVVEAAKQQAVLAEKETERCLDLSVLPLLREPWDSKADLVREHWYRSLDLRKRLAESLDI